MTKPRNMWIIESEFFKNERKFTDLTWSSKIVYIAMWIDAGDSRSEISTWRNRNRLITHLELITEAPRDVIDLAITECCKTGLITFDGDTLTVFGLEEKHPTIKYWKKTVKHPNGINLFKNSTPPRYEVGTRSEPSGNQEGTTSAMNQEPEPEQRGFKSLLHLPSNESTIDLEPELVEPVAKLKKALKDVPKRSEEEEAKEWMLLFCDTYQNNGTGIRQRREMLLKKWQFQSQGVVDKILTAGREKLIQALILITMTAYEADKPPGALYCYAVQKPIPRKWQAEVSAKLKQLVTQEGE